MKSLFRKALLPELDSLVETPSKPCKTNGSSKRMMHADCVTDSLGMLGMLPSSSYTSHYQQKPSGKRFGATTGFVRKNNHRVATGDSLGNLVQLKGAKSRDIEVDVLSSLENLSLQPCQRHGTALAKSRQHTQPMRSLLVQAPCEPSSLHGGLGDFATESSVLVPVSVKNDCTETFKLVKKQASVPCRTKKPPSRSARRHPALTEGLGSFLLEDVRRDEPTTTTATVVESLRNTAGQRSKRHEILVRKQRKQDMKKLPPNAVGLGAFATKAVGMDSLASTSQPKTRISKVLSKMATAAEPTFQDAINVAVSDSIVAAAPVAAKKKQRGGFLSPKLSKRRYKRQATEQVSPAAAVVVKRRDEKKSPPKIESALKRVILGRRKQPPVETVASSTLPDGLPPMSPISESGSVASMDEPLLSLSPISKTEEEVKTESIDVCNMADDASNAQQQPPSNTVMAEDDLPVDKVPDEMDIEDEPPSVEYFAADKDSETRNVEETAPSSQPARPAGPNPTKPQAPRDQKPPRGRTTPTKPCTVTTSDNVSNEEPMIRRSRRARVETDRLGVYAEPDREDATLRKATASLDPTDTVSETENDDATFRRSDRNRAEPSRLGNYGDLSDEEEELCRSPKTLPLPFTDVVKKKSALGFRVIERKMPFMKQPTPKLEIVSADGWSSLDVLKLKNAHGKADSLSGTFWSDVAESVSDKSAMECRDKWFSLVQTPNPKRGKKQKNTPKSPAPAAFQDEDDIFNSTPMRDENVGGAATGASIMMMDIASAIKVDAKRAVVATISTEYDSEPLEFRPKAGYKSYLKGMKRDVSRNQKLKKKPKALGMKAPRSLSEAVYEHDVDMNARLTPGGTLKMKSMTGEDNDDFWGELYGSDEEEMDSFQ